VKLKRPDGWQIGRLNAVVLNFSARQIRFRTADISQNGSRLEASAVVAPY
jgi:hypothetical protein